jgi:hypothetical protein
MSPSMTPSQSLHHDRGPSSSQIVAADGMVLVGHTVGAPGGHMTSAQIQSSGFFISHAILSFAMSQQQQGSSAGVVVGVGAGPSRDGPLATS